MTKKIINIGAAANDRQGDSLRAAFTKVNENFTELYVALGLDSESLNIGSFEFTGSTISTTDSSSVTIDQATTISSNLTVGGDLLPQTNLGGNLGSPTQKWKSLYLSSSTVYFNNIPMSVSSDGTLRINGSTVSGGSYNELTDKPTIPTNTNQLTNGAGFITSTDRLVNGSAEFRLQLDGSTPFVTFPANVGESVTVQGSEVSSDDSALVLSSFDNRVIIKSNGQGPTKEWVFDIDGTLTFPDSHLTIVESEIGRSVTNGSGDVVGSRTSYNANSVSLEAYDDPNGALNMQKGRVLALPFEVAVEVTEEGINGQIASRITVSPGNIELLQTDGVNEQSWKFDNNGELTFPDTSVQTTAWTGSVSSLVNGAHTASLGSTGILTLSNGAIATTVDNNATVNTSATVTTNNSYTNTVDFSTNVDLGGGNIIAGWYQRNSSQIEFALFGPSSFQTYLTGLALGRTVIVTYSTGSGNQTLTRTLTQSFTGTGQADPANPTWGRVSGRIDATLPADQTGIVSINFPEYSTSSKTWTFGTDGNLGLPFGGAIEASTGNMFLKGTLGSSSLAGVQDFTENSRAYAWVGAFTVETNRGVSTKTWNFRNTGELQFPDNTSQTTAYNPKNIRSDSDINIDINLSDSTLQRWTFGEDGSFTVPNGISSFENFEVKINADDSTLQTFKFDGAGGITLPNNAQIRPSSAAYDEAMAEWESARQSFELQATDAGITAQGWPFIAWQANGENAEEYLAELTRAWNIQASPGGTLVFVPAISSALYQQIRTALTVIRTAYRSADNGLSISVQSNNYTTLGKAWNFAEDGKLTFPDGAKYAGQTVTMPTTTTGTTNSFVWEFSDNAIGSDKITLNWNLLASDTSTFYIGTTHSTNGKYLILDGTDQSLGYFKGGTGGGGKLIFGESTNGGAGGVNDIELKSSTGSVRIETDNNSWAFGPDGLLSLGSSLGGIFCDQTTGRVTIGDSLSSSGNLSSPGAGIFIAGEKAFQISSSLQNKSWDFDHNGDTTIPGNIKSDGNINIEINGDDSTLRRWQFGEDGDLTVAGAILANDNLTLRASGGIPTSISNINSQGGYNIGSYAGLSTTGGTGTGLTVNASTEGNGYISTVTIVTPGTGYTDGDSITLVGGDGFGCTFTISTVPTWTFGATGRTTFPSSTAPAHSYGAAGDVAGMVAFDSGYIYYCTANYVDNSTNIWKRVALDATTW